MFAIFSSTFSTKIESYHIYVRYFVGKIYQKIIQLKINWFNEVNKFDISTKAFLMYVSHEMYSISKKSALQSNYWSWRKYRHMMIH